MLEAFQRLSLTSTQYYTQISTNQFSERLLKCPSIKRLDSLNITNFKSFKGKVYVGPLLNFTSIVGPNGAGKSNILDALMFAFCNEKNKVTYFDVREFINRQGLETYKQMGDKNKYCQVQVRFELADNRYLTVTRTLYPDEQQTFLIDGDEYPQKVYENFLMKNNINYITSNYAIWQGQIDKLLMKNPKQLTNYIEIISGSTFFRKDQEELKEELKNIEEHMTSRSVRIAKLKQEKKMMKTFKHQKKSTLKIQAQYELVLKQLVLSKALMSQLQLKELENAIKVKDKEEQKKIKEINETKVLMMREQSEKLELQKKVNILMREIGQSNTQLRNIGQLSNVIDLQNIGQLSQEIDNLEKYCTNLNYRKEIVEKDMSSLPSTNENKEYLDLYHRWQRENQAITKQMSKRKEEYLYTLGILQSKQAMMIELIEKETKASLQSKEQQQQKIEIQKNIEELDKNLSKMKVQHSKMLQEYTKSEKSIENIRNKVIEANQKIINLESILTDSLENEKDKDLVLKLKEIEGFKGIIEQWIKPSHEKYHVCFDMIVGSIFKYLLCSDEQSSKQITLKLRENYQIRNLVILSNVRQKKETVNRSALGKSAVPAIDAIKFDKQLQNFGLFLTDYLSGKVICENLETAWQILGKNIRGIKEIFTNDGNCLRQDGVVSSHGSVELSKKKYKYGDASKNNSSLMQQIQILKKQKIKEEEELEKIKKKNNQEVLSNHTLDMQRLEAKKEELKLKLDWLKKSIQTKRESKIPKGLEKDIQQFEKKVKNLSQGVNEIEREMLKSNIFEEFLKKNQIDSLEHFRSVQDLSSLEDVIKKKNKYTKELQELQRQLDKITTQINQKKDKLQHLQEKVNGIKGFSQKGDLEKTIKKKEKELIQTRSELAKVKLFNPEALKFKSQVAQMSAKLEIMKERREHFLKKEAESLGLSQIPSSSEYNLLEEPLGIKVERASKERVQILEEELLKEKDSLEKQLQKNNISLTEVKSQFQNEQSLDNQISRITQQLKEENQRKNDINQKLDKVKEDRKSIFMNYLNQLKPILTEAYQTLTEKENGSGRVDIFMENQAFPCDDGLYYTPVPPTKRFVYDLDQLSGGQKSIASLALQYSIALASKSPFLILDQTDAFLDSQNTKRFVDLIKKTLSDRNLQFIIITHKRSLFLSGESLVGVTKFKDDPFSKAFSLRINGSSDPDQQEGDFE